jgi:hypothetical protein
LVEEYLAQELRVGLYSIYTIYTTATHAVVVVASWEDEECVMSDEHRGIKGKKKNSNTPADRKKRGQTDSKTTRRNETKRTLRRIR